MEALTASAERPTRPLAATPGGYVELARYSSLVASVGAAGRGAERGPAASVACAATRWTCAAAVLRVHAAQCLFFLDTARLLKELEDGFEPHPTLVDLLSGNP